jgi:hypothetical protein
MTMADRALGENVLVMHLGVCLDMAASILIEVRLSASYRGLD